LINVAIAEE
jgi:hypothetical protein